LQLGILFLQPGWPAKRVFEQLHSYGESAAFDQGLCVEFSSGCVVAAVAGHQFGEVAQATELAQVSERGEQSDGCVEIVFGGGCAQGGQQAVRLGDGVDCGIV
jgi:hypothetical protein